jgi:hypothetical protein
MVLLHLEAGSGGGRMLVQELCDGLSHEVT